MAESGRKREVTLTEYDVAGYEFLMTGTDALMRATDPVYRRIRRVPLDDVSSVSVDVGEGRTVRAEPIDASSWISFDVREAIAGERQLLLSEMAFLAQRQLATIMSAFYSHVNEVAEAVGNTVSGPMSWDLIIDALERVDRVFGDDGEHGGMIVMNPETYARLVQQGPPTAAQEARLDDILRRKREEFDARRRHRSVPRDGH
ncbi:hypothetical protein JNW91_11750 [Micromonospora sp. STR1_7]|uniref:Uncharacterized protein n=1 Tax=Micromonospora parastrephiae TaxID=2806101 RepID=A0ABS1XTI9_9ACTN|nr:hypothetical protein [Micromonospora parastrephiae]MBM0232479.1 hypothetical protein [Micromonospora parastrephiae]